MGRTTWADLERALAARLPTRLADPVEHRAAVAMILREAAPGLEILFIRRAEHPHDPWSGQMAFPGGRSEPGDADLRVTAVRETAEEIGLDLDTHATLLGGLDEVRAMARLRPMNLAITPFVFRLVGAAPDLSLSSEVFSVHWLPLDELLGADRRSTMDYVHRGTSLQFPCLRIDDVVIWGLTYRMFASLEAALGVVPGSEARGQ